MKFLLINSNPDSAFAAFSAENKLYMSYASSFMSDAEKQNSIKSPDKLIQCFEAVALRVYRPEGSPAGQDGDLKSIDAVAVTTGPGSFTGIRVGLAIAKGAAAALGKKIIPIDNFELTFNRIKEPDPDIVYCVLLPESLPAGQAKLPEYYYTIFMNNKPEEIGVLQKSELSSKIGKNTLIVGDFSDDSVKKDSYLMVLQSNQLKTEAESMVELTKRKFSSGAAVNPEDVKPVYIKDFVMKNKTHS